MGLGGMAVEGKHGRHADKGNGFWNAICRDYRFPPVWKLYFRVVILIRKLTLLLPSWKMPTFQELFAAIKQNPLATMLTICILFIVALLIKIDRQETRAEKLLRETSAAEKRCADEKERQARQNQIEKDSIYLINLRFANSAIERLTKLKEEIKKIKR